MKRMILAALMLLGLTLSIGAKVNQGTQISYFDECDHYDYPECHTP